MLFVVNIWWLSFLTGARPYFLFDTLLEAGPTLLPRERLQAPVDSVLHHCDELLVRQQTVSIIVKDL